MMPEAAPEAGEENRDRHELLKRMSVHPLFLVEQEITDPSSESLWSDADIRTRGAVVDLLNFMEKISTRRRVKITEAEAEVST